MKIAFALFTALAIPSVGLAAGPPVTTVSAQPRNGQPGYTLFARVEAIQVLVIRAGTTGTVNDLHAKPGDHVRAGERLARLGGPAYAAALASSRAAFQAARKSARLAHDQLEATRARYPVLSNRNALDQARHALASAEANLIRAQAEFAALKAQGTILAPAAGTISDVLRSDGERISPGGGIVEIHPSGSLWLRGAIYGKQVSDVRVGMRGQFEPADGGHPIAVRVTSLIPGGATDGLGIGFVAISPMPKWFDGESGLVTLHGRRSREPAIPTRALVLDHGHWWVVEKVGRSFKPHEVTPDGSRNGWTWIAAGLKPGDQVVSIGAYGIFHRSFSKQYSGD